LSVPEQAVRQSRQYCGEVFHKLTAQKESRIEDGHLQPDHVHMLISIPAKYTVSQVVRFLKKKSAIHIARVCTEKGNEISLAKGFGLAAFSFPTWGVMKP
jgi:REP element-mobilizing transposase RayT